MRQQPLASLLIFSLCTLLVCTENGTWHTYSTKNSPFSTDFIRQIVVEEDSLLWVGTYGDGLYRRKGSDWEKVTAPFRAAYILSLVKENGGGLWAGTARNGAYYYNFSSQSWRRIGSEHGLIDDNVWHIFIENDQCIWFCSRYKGVSNWCNDTMRHMTTENGLYDRQVTTAVRDSTGRLWFGTVRGGLCGVKDEQWEYINKTNGLSGNYIRAVLCDSIPRWVGTWDGGLDHYNGKNWEQYAYVKKPVVFLGFDHNHALWVGTWGSGVYVIDPDTVMHIHTANSGLADDYVIDIDFTIDGTVYFATNKGISVYTPPDTVHHM